MARVKFIGSWPALCWDPQHQRMVKVVRSVDTRGRRWEEHSADGGGVPVLLDSPPEPQRKARNRRGR